MDTLTLVFVVLAAALLVATWQTARLGQERRDVALLAAMAGALGIGSVVSAAL
ncbi:hypothetical protein [Ideonella sp.]|uniref:hypothetical protein n=1 Tax=Ideonella sp. TaxID=1929293 RepID=UPI0035B4188C